MAYRILAAVAALVAAVAAYLVPAQAQQGGDEPGNFDYYALVLSWSPTHCSESDGSGDDLQCNRNDGRRYAFVLHGLWPQYERGYPENCRTRNRSFVAAPVIDRMLDIMPSRNLVIHEYRKHGTCSGLNPGEYYETARKLFRSVSIPHRFANPFESQFISPDALIGEFLDENPELNEDMIAVSCRGSGNRLREVRICFGKDGKPQACGENQRDLCRAPKMFVPPVRSSKLEADTAEDRQQAVPKSPLPMPRLIPGPH